MSVPNKKTENPPLERLLTAKQLNEIWGLNPKTAMDWARRGILPCIRLHTGQRRSVIRFPEKALIDWLEKRKAEAQRIL